MKVLRKKFYNCLNTHPYSALISTKGTTISPDEYALLAYLRTCPVNVAQSTVYPYLLQQLSVTLGEPLETINGMAWRAFGEFKSRVETGVIKRRLRHELWLYYANIYAQETGTSLSPVDRKDKVALTRQIITAGILGEDKRMDTAVDQAFREPALKYIRSRLYDTANDGDTMLYDDSITGLYQAVRKPARKINKGLYEYFMGILKNKLNDLIKKKQKDRRAPFVDEDVDEINPTDISGHEYGLVLDNIIERYALLERLQLSNNSEVLSKLFQLFGKPEQCKQLLTDIFVDPIEKEKLLTKYGWSDVLYRKKKSDCIKNLTTSIRIWLDINPDER